MKPEPEFLKLNSEAEFFVNNELVTHERTLEMLHKSLFLENSVYAIVIGHERKVVDVEDVGLFVTALKGSAELGFLLQLSDKSEEPLELAKLRYEHAGRLMIEVLERRGQRLARFLRAPYHELLALAEWDPDPQVHRLRVGGHEILLKD